jgi:3-oxoadipate enol-lactonase
MGAMTSESGIADVNGTRLAYEAVGEGPAVVFVHGFTLDRRMWDDQLPTLRERYRVVRYDLRGFGASACPEPGEPYTHADDLRALLTHLGIDQAAIVGLSLGGWVAHEFALTYPDSVRALVLVDSALRGYRWQDPKVAATLETLYRLGAEGRLAEAKAGWLADPLFAGSHDVPGVVPRLAQMVETYSCWHLQHDDPHPPLQPPAMERLHEIAAPTLVVVGERDLPDFHAIADLLVARIPDARKVVLPGAGHMANMDAPEAFNRAVLAFLDAVSQSTRPSLGGRL